MQYDCFINIINDNNITKFTKLEEKKLTIEIILNSGNDFGDSTF